MKWFNGWLIAVILEYLLYVYAHFDEEVNPYLIGIMLIFCLINYWGTRILAYLESEKN